MEEPPLNLVQTQVAILKNELAFQTFKGRKIPREFHLNSVQFHLDREDMGILKLIAVIDLRHLSGKFDREYLNRARSVCSKKGIGDIGLNDPIGNQPLSV